VIISKKKQFTLVNNIYPNKMIYNLIIKKIPNSIFSKLNFFFFKKIIKKKIINFYLIKKKDKISSIISTTTVANYELLKKEIFFYLILNPFIIIVNIKFFFNLIKRDSNIIDNNYKKKYLHLLHLIIFKKDFTDYSLREKDNIINFFFKKILNINNANYFYLCYETNNTKAHKFYMRNKFAIYKKNEKIIFIKKKLI